MFSRAESPDKHKTTYEQWLYGVETIQQNYPQFTVKESIVRSLKGAASRILTPLGPKATVGDIVGQLEAVYGTVTSSDELMQDFFQLKKTKLEKVQTFVTRIEESLSRIRSRFPGRIAIGEVDEYLEDCFFHGMYKRILTC